MRGQTRPYHAGMKSPLRVLFLQMRARVRLVVAIAFGAGLFMVLPADWPQMLTTRLLLSWNAAVLLYLVMVFWVVITSNMETMKQRAYRQDEGQKTILLLTTVAVMASLVAIVAEFSSIKMLTGSGKTLHIALTAMTVGCSWLFMHLMFAMHYAHDYYLHIRRGQEPGLLFPQETAPDYWDFLYFAAVIGTSGQTADVSFTSKSMRRIGLAHCVLAYFYNTTVLALTINIAAGLM
jgi:uncharacterized membrane protein